MITGRCIVCFCFLFCLFLPGLGATPPKREVRAVWIATANGLDWPTSTDRDEQRASLATIVRTLAAHHFNTLYFQARSRGDALYRSRHEPWSESLTGIMGKDPGWDPLAELIADAHRYGIEVHAWVNVFKVRNNSNGPIAPTHPSRRFPQWTVRYEEEEWMDPGFPGVRNYLLNVILDIVDHYDIDGINLDFARYPGRDFKDDRSFKTYGKGMDRDSWRVKNVSDFVAAVYDGATFHKPRLKVGSSPVGVPGTVVDVRSLETLRKYSQDAPSWVIMGKQDYIVPQIYWTIGGEHGEPDFSNLTLRWRRFTRSRQVIAGIGAYRPDVLMQLRQQIDTARSNGVNGEAFFRYAHIAQCDSIEFPYRYPAIIPEMPWKDDVPPLPPGTAAATEIHPGIFQIEWVPAQRAQDGDLPTRYVLYRGSGTTVDISDPRSIIASVGGETTMFTDSLAEPNASIYSFAVTSLDRMSNESKPARIPPAVEREILALRTNLLATTPQDFVLNHNGKELSVVYRLQERTYVRLEVVKREKEGNEKILKIPIDESQEQGVYILTLERPDEQSLFVHFKAGEMSVTRPIPPEGPAK